MQPSLVLRLTLCSLVFALLPDRLHGQVTTPGFLNQPRPETQGTPINLPGPVNAVDPSIAPPNGNDTLSMGRTVTLNYLNGWLVVGAEGPGSSPGSDLSVRVFDISDPTHLIRRRPSDFGHSFSGQAYNDIHFPGDFWWIGNAGWNAHGTAWSGPYLLPAPVLRVTEHGGTVELGGQGGVPPLNQMPLLYNRSSQAGPWWATMVSYGNGADLPGAGEQMEIRRAALSPAGIVEFPGQLLGTIDHNANFGGGDWHPVFFGDLLIYAKRGPSDNSGVVVYRLSYHNFDDGEPGNDSVSAQLVGALEGGFDGYWPNLFSDGSGLQVIGSTTGTLAAVDITAAADPDGDGQVIQGPVLNIPGFTNASYPVYQDQFAFIHNRKINMSHFLAGLGEASIVLTLDEQAHGVCTSQMSLPLGNLWVTGGSATGSLSQGMAIWVHQQEPDETAPAVSYHVPQTGRVNYPRFAPLSFLLHEHPRHGGLRNGIDFAVRPVDPLDDTPGLPVEGYLIQDFAGVVTFTPEGGLEADTTYQVDFFSDDSDPADPVGFVDVAGNFIEPYTFRFSTGGGLDSVPLPQITSLEADDYQPAPGETVTVSASADPGVPGALLEFRFNFDGTWSAWTTTNTANHLYNDPGRYRVLAQVRQDGGTPVLRVLNLLVIAELPGPAPTRNSSITVGDDSMEGRRTWVVNPDADTVSLLDPVTGALLAEIPAGDEPRSIARDGNGRYWVTCQASDEIRIFNADTSLHAVIPLPYGSAPFGIAPSPDGESLFVTLFGSGRLQRYLADDPSQPPTSRTTFPTPRALAVSGDGSRVLVTRFLSPDLEAEVGEYNGVSPSLDAVRIFRLASSNAVDGGDRSAGVPNYLTGIAISPDGTRAAVVSKQDNIQRGELYGVNDLTFETSVRSVVSFLDLENNTEIPHSRKDFDNSDSPSAVSYTPLGDTLLVTLQGNNRLVGIDALSLSPVEGLPTAGATLVSPAVKTLETPTGEAPQGILVDPVTGRVLVQNFLGRSVSVFDAASLLEENHGDLPPVATTATVAAEPLAPDVLAGKRLFYNASDPRMSADGYLSCATCHLAGGHDGRTWDFTGRGEGLRRTTDLRARGGTNHGNVHWSGNFDEIQDFEHDIRNAFGGEGFLPLLPGDFAAQHPSPASVKAGLSDDLDALAAYVGSLGNASAPRSPHRYLDGSLTDAALRGREVFVNQNCHSCHSGAGFTDSDNSPSLHNVGTLSLLSGQRLGAELTGIDTPTLIGLHASRSFLHHGLAGTLEEVFDSAGGAWLHAPDGELLGGGAVTIINDNPAEGGGGYLRGPFEGGYANITGAPENGVRFSLVDGGAGGTARIAVRFVRHYNPSSAVIRINGAEQVLALPRQYPDNGWMVSGWLWQTVEVALNPGQSNTIDVIRGPVANGDFLLNGILVANADILAASQPHHLVASLPLADRDDLLSYLRQLDGSPGEAPEEPVPGLTTVSITPLPGFLPPLTASHIDLDVIFSAAVSGLAVDDFVLGGTSGATAAELFVLSEGLHYRLRVGGFSQGGTLSVQLPADSVDGPGGGPTGEGSLPEEVVYSPPLPDDLAPLSDEFDDPDTITNWLRNEEVEGWGGSKLEQWDIDTTAPGQMRLMPYSSSWYEDFTGAYVYKEVTGDFVLTTRLDVTNRAGSGRPNSDYSLAGLMVRASRGLSNASPQPDPGSAAVLPWPPPANGQPNHYTTPWQPDTENYLFLSFGFGAASASPDGSNPNRWHYEVKTTTNGVSTLYPRTHGVPENEPSAMLQIVRRGSTFLLLRRHGEGPWIIENRFERPDLPETLQIGITTYTDWNTVAAGWNYSDPQIPFHQNRIVNTGVGNPDIISDVDFVRIRRPDPAINAAALQAVGLTGPSGPVV
ncbi:MAG: Ig-like domain-containing protein, partial [Verrucomicrobiae bacterium]|nr:Ig-like domain-containing protein [Verrucomicrobiae bacterium]